jgi:hypothetical protein
MGSLRGAIGSPEQVVDLVSRYDAAGVDQMIFVLQAGRNRHEHICESLELFAAEVMPRFADGRERREAEKAKRLADAVERALARRAPTRALATPYVIDERAEIARARRTRQTLSPRQLTDLALDQARGAAREGVVRLLARLTEGASDEQLERRFGSGVAQRALFAGLARSYNADAAGGFQGALVYELTRSATGSPPVRWTISVQDGRAAATPGGAADPQLTLRFALADFIRIAAGRLDAAVPLLEDRAQVEGDFALAARLPEMFGGTSPY